MSKTTKLNFETLENPYNDNLDRGEEEMDSLADKTGLFRTSGTSESASEVDKEVSGQDLTDLWISSWIKSRNYKPKSSGFFLDGKTGAIKGAECYFGDSDYFIKFLAGKLTLKAKNSNLVLYEAVVDVNGNGDYTNLQSAINAGKKRIFVRAGTYTLSNNITIPDGCTIIGEDNDTTIFDFNGTTKYFDIRGIARDTGGINAIAYTNNSKIITGTGTSWNSAGITTGDYIIIHNIPNKIASIDSNTQITLVNNWEGVTTTVEQDWKIFTVKKDITISNIMIKNGTGTTLMYIGYGVFNYLADNCILKECSGAGIMTSSGDYEGVVSNCDIFACNEGIKSAGYHLTITNNKVTNCNTTGIYLYNYSIASNNIIGGCGIGIAVSQRSLASGNQLIKNNTGIEQYGYCSVDNNYFKSNSLGLKNNVSYGMHANITNNVFENNTTIVSLGANAYRSVIANNIFISETANAASAVGNSANNIIISNNNFYKCYISNGGTYINITGNNFDGGYYALKDDTMFDVVFSNNIINSTVSNGIHCGDRMSRCKIDNNKFYNCGATAIYVDIGTFGYFQYNQITDNYFKDITGSAIWAIYSSNPTGADKNTDHNVISGNYIKTTTGANSHGIYLQAHSTYNTINNNNINGCGYKGIWLLGNSTHNTLIGNNVTGCIDGIVISAAGCDKNNVSVNVVANNSGTQINTAGANTVAANNMTVA